MTTFQNGQKWTLQNGKPVPVDVSTTQQPMDYQTTQTVPADQDQQKAATRASEAKKGVIQQIIDQYTNPAAQQMYRQ